MAPLRWVWPSFLRRRDARDAADAAAHARAEDVRRMTPGERMEVAYRLFRLRRDEVR